MAFFEQQLTPKFSFGARGGPVFNTSVATVDGGARVANQNWTMPLHRFNISHAVRDNDAFEELRSFFYCVSGMYDGFRFKDWADFQLNQKTATLVFITGTTWQITRVYVKGVRTFSRPIYKPVSGKVSIWRIRSGVTSLATATIDSATGIVTVSGHVSGDTYFPQGEFDVPVAFTSDVMEVEITDKNVGAGLLMSWPSVEVEEIRL